MSNEKWVSEYINKMLDLYDKPSSELEKEIINFKKDKINENGGKLYKYCALPDMYNILNVYDDVTYFNNPSRFNDPFDCAIGISEDDLFDFYMQQLINMDMIKSSMKEAERKTKSIKINNANDVTLLLKSLPNDFKEYLNTFIEDKDVIDYYKNNITNNEIKERIIDKISSNKFYQLITKTSKIKLGDKQKGDFRQASLRITSSIKGYYKERDFSFSLTDFYNILEKAGYSLDLEKFKNQFNNTVKELVNNYKAEIDKNFKVSCFTTSPENQLMWSHYANKHQGFCLEYDLTNLSKEYNKILIGLFPVKYTKKRPQAMFDCYNIYKEIKIETKLNSKHKKHILQSLRTKSDIWKKEDEWRILLVDEPENVIKLPIVSKIYLGANMQQEDKETLIKIAKSKGIKCKEMKIHNKEYSFL